MEVLVLVGQGGNRHVLAVTVPAVSFRRLGLGQPTPLVADDLFCVPDPRQ